MSSGEIKITQSSLFGRKAKKLRKKDKEILDSEIRRILQNPKFGQEKKGDLKGVYLRKFKMNKQLILLAYQFSDKALQLIAFGPHENYYRDLKSYRK